MRDRKSESQNILELVAEMRDRLVKVEDMVTDLHAGLQSPTAEEVPTGETLILVTSANGEKAPWIYKAEEFVGFHEEDDNETIVTELLEPAGIDIDPAETPWCAAFVDAILHLCSLPTLGSLRARDFAEYGTECEAVPGAIVVYRSHVGFIPEAGKCLGGNQSDGITIGNIEWYGKPIAYRCPEGYKLI